MPMGRYPDKVDQFQKWASEKVKNSKLSDSATPHRMRMTSKRRRRRKKRQDG